MSRGRAEVALLESDPVSRAESSASALRDALAAALETGGGELDPAAAASARAALSRASGRLRSGSAASVVALAGATGSGKSSLVNALAGMAVAEVGVRRPTTSVVTACVWGEVPEALLDWLDVPRRHRTERVSVLDADTQAPLEGLVLLDLPDHDSTSTDHRALVDRLVAQVDRLVWVADPQKYADDALHAGYLRSLSGHQDVVLVVLNQIDTLGPAGREACAGDLRRLLDADGLDQVPLIQTSARSGEGVEVLREALVDVVAERTAAWRRSRADLASATVALRAGVGDAEPDPTSVEGADALVDALASAAGVPALVDAVATSRERAGRSRTGWPFTRWVRSWRPDPLRRLHLGAGATGEAAGRDGLGEAQAAALVSLQRTSLPAPTAIQRAGVTTAARQVAASAAASLPPRWGQAVRDAAVGTPDGLNDSLDQAMAGLHLDRRTPAWWSAVGALQAVLALATAVGALWLVALGVLGWLELPRPSTPGVGGQPFSVPLPTLLLIGGGVLGAAVAAVAGAAVRRGAARAGEVVREQAYEAVGVVADEKLLWPVDDVLTRHRRTRELLEEAARAAS